MSAGWTKHCARCDGWKFGVCFGCPDRAEAMREETDEEEDEEEEYDD